MSWLSRQKRDFKLLVSYIPIIMRKPLTRAYYTLGIAFALGTYFYAHGQSWDHGQLIDLKLAITLALVETPLLMLTPILYRSIFDESRQKEVKEEKKKHKETFYDILDKIPTLPYIDWEKQEINKFGWCDNGGYPLFPFLKSHLKEYELGRLYQRCRNFYDDKTNGMEEKIKEFNDYVDKSLETFRDLPNIEDYDREFKTYMIKNRIKKGIFSSIAARNRGNYTNQLLQYSSGQNSMLMLGAYGCAEGDENTIKKLAEIVTPLFEDEKLVSIIKELNSMIEKMNVSSKNIFEEGRKRLFLTLREGQRNLEGRCELCPR